MLLPACAADQPALVLGIVAQAANQLSPDTRRSASAYVASGGAPAPDGPFIAVSDLPPSAANPRVRFDRGRVAVTDRSGRTLLDLGGFAAAPWRRSYGRRYPGLWIKPLSPDGRAPAPPELHLDHGDVAFIDDKGVALAMSTERDTVVRISYPDQVSWLTVAERFRSWIIAGLWLFATAALLLVLQRMFRRRARRRDTSRRCRCRRQIVRSAIFWSVGASSRCRSSTRRSVWRNAGTCGSATRCCRATGSIRGSTTRPTRRISTCRSSI